MSQQRLVTQPIVTPVAAGVYFALRTSSATPPINPADWFPTAAERGGVYDLTDPTKLFQDNLGTVPVTAPLQPIGYVVDLSGHGHPLLQATAANKPTWRGSARDVGPELLTNGRIDTASGWTLPTGWDFAVPKITKTAGTANAAAIPAPVTAGKLYMVAWTCERTAGTITARFTGGTTVAAPSRSAAGSYVQFLVAAAGNNTLEFLVDAAFAGSIKSVSVKEVTAQVCMGAYMFGSPQRLVSAAINMSNSQTMTVGYSTHFNQETANGTVVAVGNWASVAGSTWSGLIPPVGRIRGDTNAGSIQLATVDGITGAGAAFFVDVFDYDLAQTTLATEVKVTSSGITRSGTASGSTAGAGNWNSSLTIDLGVASLRGSPGRVVVRNSHFTGQAKADRDAWLKHGFCYACFIGDSTLSGLSGAIAVRSRVASFVAGAVCGRYDISESGRKIADMKGFFLALDDVSAIDVVYVEIGLNDVKGRVGEGLATTAQVIADLQDLVNTIRGRVSAKCKIIIGQLNPAKQWLLTATNGAAAYSAWQAVNTAVAGGGATPITGVDARVTAHVAMLSDGADNLAAIYDYFNDHVHESTEAAFYKGALCIRPAFEGLGLLLPP